MDISVRNARSTAAPYKRDLWSIVVGLEAIVKRYFEACARLCARVLETVGSRRGIINGIQLMKSIHANRLDSDPPAAPPAFG